MRSRDNRVCSLWRISRFWGLKLLSEKGIQSGIRWAVPDSESTALAALLGWPMVHRGWRKRSEGTLRARVRVRQHKSRGVAFWVILKGKQTVLPGGLDVGCGNKESTARLFWLKLLEELCCHQPMKDGKRADEGSLVQCWIWFPVGSWVVTGGSHGWSLGGVPDGAHKLRRLHWIWRQPNVSTGTETMPATGSGPSRADEWQCGNGKGLRLLSGN